MHSPSRSTRSAARSTGTGTLHATTCTGIPLGAVQVESDATGTITPFGPVALSLSLCVPLVSAPPDFHTPVEGGSFTLTAADGVVAGALSGWVEPFNHTPNGFPYEFVLAPNSAAGRDAGATGSITLQGFFGIGATTIDGTASGTVSLGTPIPTVANDCKNDGWRHVVDVQGHSFKNQGLCIAFVQHQRA